MIQSNIPMVLMCLTAMLTVSPPVSAPRTVKTFADQKTGVRLLYPANLRPRACGYGSGSDYESCIVFNRKGEPDSFLYVTIRKGTLETGIAAADGFEKVKGEWFRRGRLGMLGKDKAEAITGPGWQGIAAMASCGVQDEPGGPVSLRQCLTAIVSDGHQSVNVETDGRLDVDAARKNIVSSIRFSNKVPSHK